MATQLFKIVVDANTTSDIEISPEITQYFYPFASADLTDTVLTIPATKFIDDAGDLVTGNLTIAAPDNGYYLLFINGVLQQSDLYEVDVNGANVVVQDAATILAGSPITLIVTNFDPTSTSDTTVTT